MGDIFIGVGALIFDDEGRVLLVKHSYESFWKGKWILPGGRLHFGEKLEECARREVLEETGISVRILRHLITFDRIVREGDRVTLHVIYIVFTARVIGGVVSPSSELSDARWFTSEEIRSRVDEMHPDTVVILRAAGLL